MSLIGRHTVVLNSEFMRLPFMKSVVGDEGEQIHNGSVLHINLEIIDDTHHFGLRVGWDQDQELVIPWRNVVAIFMLPEPEPVLPSALALNRK